jgi:hypothetical protein
MTTTTIREDGVRVNIVRGNDVVKCDQPLNTTNAIDFLRTSSGYKIESCSDYTGEVVMAQAGLNTLISTSQLAFAKHYPITFSPDILWITLLNGLSNHINENAETLRHHFVEHEGQENIEIRRDSFRKGSPENDWADCFDEFSAKIKDRIGEDNHNSIVTEFSTSTPITKASCEVVLMDAMKSYFSYTVKTCCGIPYFNVEGDPDDYLNIKEKVSSWAKWDLSWWTDCVNHIIDNFVLAAKGEPDESWWEHFYKEGGGSGGPYISGWVNWLFPYLEKRKGTLTKNESMGKLKNEGFFGGPCTDDFGPSYANCPFVWNYYGKEFDYKFIAGLMALDQNSTGDQSLKPRIAWAVTPDEKIEQKKPNWMR